MKHYRYSYTRCFGLAVAGSLLIFLMLGTVGSAFAQSTPLIGYCNYCSSSAAYANAAEQAAPNAAPGNGTPVTYPVYVINPANGNTQYFNVLVWYDWGDGQPESVDPGDAKTSTAESGGTIQHHGLHKEAYPGNGDSSIISAMQQAHLAVLQFFHPANWTVDSSDIPNSGDSAVPMVGPGAETNRASLALGVGDYVNDLWHGLAFGLSDLGVRIGGRLIGSNGGYASPMTLLKVNYPDGTSILVQITDRSTSPTGEVTVLAKVLPETARLPNGNAVPQNGAGFENFSYGGGTPLIDFLSDLAYMYGIPITGSGSGSIMCTRVDGGPLVCDLRHF